MRFSRHSAAPIGIAACIVFVAMGSSGARAAGGNMTLSFARSGAGGSHPGALEISGKEVRVDLSAVPRSARVIRAVLRVARDPDTNRGSNDLAFETIRITADGAPLELRPPRYADFDATAATLKAAGAGSKVVFNVERFGGWKPEKTRLDVTIIAPISGGSSSAAQRASGVQAWHRAGQTFVTWKAPDTLLSKEDATIQDLKEARKKSLAGPVTRFAVYRSRRAITSETIGEAELIDEVDGFTIWNGEFHGVYPKPEDPALRYALRDGEAPAPPGTGVYVHRPSEAGKAWYAVVLALDGAQDFSSLADGGAVGPIEETVGSGEPVLQRVETPKSFNYVDNPKLEYYVKWESPPECNLPSQPFDYLVGLPPRQKDPAAACVALHCWGGSLRSGYGWWYGGVEGTVLLATNEIPYDWWASYHENLGTLRSFREGKCRDYTFQRVWSFVEWAQKKWKLDANRTFMAGSSMGGSGVSHWIRHGDRFAYGISWVGVHVPLESPQFKSSYESVVGKPDWKIQHESGQPVWDYLDGVQDLRANPQRDAPFLAFSNGKNDGAIGWKQAVDFAKALQAARQPHLFTWGQEGHGQRAYIPTAGAGGDNPRDVLDFRRDRSLPAFSHCSLDDDPGDGDPSKGAPKGQLNLYLRWEPEAIVDEPDRWAATVYLIRGAPGSDASVDITPRRARAFRIAPGGAFAWSVRAAPAGAPLQSGEGSADPYGLCTATAVKTSSERRTIEMRRLPAAAK
jgi:hypothetical protein